MTPLTRDEASVWIDAVPDEVYDLVADVTRTPEWSPEIVSCEWLDGATGPAVGARFRARNRITKASWANEPVVVAADRGREFAFARRERAAGEVVWRYRFDGTGSGTTVTESYEVTRKIPWVTYLVFRLYGSRDRVRELRDGMEATLLRVKAAAETSGGGTGEITT